MRAFTIRSSDISRCPKNSISARHYHQDGVCKCVRPATDAQVIRRTVHQVWCHTCQCWVGDPFPAAPASNALAALAQSDAQAVAAEHNRKEHS